VAGSQGEQSIRRHPRAAERPLTFLPGAVRRGSPVPAALRPQASRFPLSPSPLPSPVRLRIGFVRSPRIEPGIPQTAEAKRVASVYRLASIAHFRSPRPYDRRGLKQGVHHETLEKLEREQVLTATSESLESSGKANQSVSRLHQAFTCLSPRLLPLTKGRYQ